MSHPQDKKSPSQNPTDDSERARRIQELKKAVAEGTYKIKVRDLACDLLGTLIES